MEDNANLLILYERNQKGDYEYIGIAVAVFKGDCCEIMSTTTQLDEKDLLDGTSIGIIGYDEYEIPKNSKIAFVNHDVGQLVKIQHKYKMPHELIVDMIIEEYQNTVLYNRGDGLYSKISFERYDSVNYIPKKDTSSKTKEETLDVKKIIEDIKKKFVAQEEVVESIISNIYINQMLVKSEDRDFISTSKSAILLDGPTGTGKTAILKEVAEQLKLPIVIAKSTDYSAAGYVGDSLVDILSTLLDKANGDLKLAERGIVCMDELDKLASERTNELKMKRAVQHDLLTFIGGSKYNIKKGISSIEFDTTNLTFIGMGAFTSLTDKKKQKEKSFGFQINNLKEQSLEQIYEIKDQDYVDYGLERELVGRLTLKTHTNAYEIEDFKRILLESEISPLKMFVKVLKKLGVDEITYDEQFIDKVCKKAYESGFGARGLQAIFLDIRNNLSMQLIENNLTNLHLSEELFEKVKQKSLRKY